MDIAPLSAAADSAAAMDILPLQYTTKGPICNGFQKNAPGKLGNWVSYVHIWMNPGKKKNSRKPHGLGFGGILALGDLRRDCNGPPAETKKQTPPKRRL